MRGYSGKKAGAQDQHNIRGADFARACAIEMHMDIAQEPLHARIYSKNAAGQMEHPDLTLAWTRCLGNHVLAEPVQALIAADAGGTHRRRLNTKIRTAPQRERPDPTRTKCREGPTRTKSREGCASTCENVTKTHGSSRIPFALTPCAAPGSLCWVFIFISCVQRVEPLPQACRMPELQILAVWEPLCISSDHCADLRSLCDPLLQIFQHGRFRSDPVATQESVELLCKSTTKLPRILLVPGCTKLSSLILSNGNNLRFNCVTQSHAVKFFAKKRHIPGKLNPSSPNNLAAERRHLNLAALNVSQGGPQSVAAIRLRGKLRPGCPKKRFLSSNYHIPKAQLHQEKE